MTQYIIKIEELLDAGVHFGHRVTKWNPRMAPFIYGERNKIHIIDLVQTSSYLMETKKFLREWAAQIQNSLGGREAPSRAASSLDTKQQTAGSASRSCEAQSTGKVILFVGTRKQARASIQHVAGRIPGAYYVTQRWLGGLLTNWSTMKVCIDLLNSLESQVGDGPGRSRELSSSHSGTPATLRDLGSALLPDLSEVAMGGNEADYSTAVLLEQTAAGSPSRSRAESSFQAFPKKEQALLKKQYQKLNMYFGGMKGMKTKPNLVIIVGQDSEMNAVRECQKLQDRADFSYEANKSAMAGYNQNRQQSNGAEPTTSLRTITFLDTNCDPELADFFIPANDDSTKSIDFILNHLADALLEK